MSGRSNDSTRGSGSDQSLSRRPKAMLVRDLPGLVHDELCDHLDSLDVWKILAQYVELRKPDVEQIQNQKMRNCSPTSKFLEIWGGQYNQTVHSLFRLLQELGLHHGMRILRDCVSERYRREIPQSVPAFSALGATPDSNVKINNGPTQSSSGVSDDNNDTNSLESPENITVSSVQRSAHSMLMIDYQELVEATENWSPDNNLGSGGFGEVFKGEWKQTDVAIKVMKYRQNSSNNTQVELQQSYNELKYLCSNRHSNIVALYGYSLNGERPCLVYELMPNGSLDSRLKADSSKPPLSWRQRLSIALGTAKGINFLHTARIKPLIHGDIKPANILLDQCLQPRIGDFGLAREGPHSINDVRIVQKIFGTRIYLPPEFLTLKELSTGVDIFSFGIVLLEMFTGRLMAECTKKGGQQDLLNYLRDNCQQSNPNSFELFDTKLVRPIGEELDKCMLAKDVGVRCVSPTPHDRPAMVETCKMFKSFSIEL